MPRTLDELRADLLESRVELQKQLAGVEAAIEGLGVGATETTGPTVASGIRTRRPMNPAARAAVSARMKKYWAERRKKTNKR